MKRSKKKQQQDLVWPVRKPAEYYNIHEGPTLFDELESESEIGDAEFPDLKVGDRN